MYGGWCCSEYVSSLLNLGQSLTSNGHEMVTMFLGNESLIQRARNTITWYFLNIQDATHLLFIDADIKFKVKDIARMISSNKPIITAPVPLKGINWEGVERAVKEGVPVNELYKYTGIYNLKFLDVKSKEEAFEIEHGGTGMMLIQRKVFEELIPHTKYYTNSGANIPKNSKVYDFFRVENSNNTLLSEDYYFCKSYKDIGGSIWTAPWCEVTHFGSYMFHGHLI